MDGLYDIPKDGKDFNLYDYQARDLGVHPENDKISDASKVLAALFTLAHAADWSQTLHIARNPDKYYEKDSSRFIGTHPSTGKVNSYMLFSGLTNGLGPFLFSKPYREILQGIALSDKLRVIKQNEGIGIGLKF